MKPGVDGLTLPGRAILAADPVWAAYAIADLRPDLARCCRWSVSPEHGGLALLYTGLEPPILMTAGRDEGVAAALCAMDLPPKLFLSIQPSHLNLVQSHYPHIETECMLRMHFRPCQNLPKPDHFTRSLSRQDHRRLQNLYEAGGQFAPDAFDSSQLDDGFFFGIDDNDGSLRSAGGTHVAYATEHGPSSRAADSQPLIGDTLDPVLTKGVAAIGNVYTRPDCRGKGYGTAVTASILHALRSAGFAIIVLNVNARNLAAQSIYEKLGFERHSLFIEGLASRSQQIVS